MARKKQKPPSPASWTAQSGGLGTRGRRSKKAPKRKVSEVAAASKARPGRRQRARQRQRRQGLLRTGALALVAIVSVVAVGVLANVLVTTEGAVNPDQTTGTVAPRVSQTSFVFATFDEEDPEAEATLIVVMAFDEADGRGTLLFAPPSTVADVPGFGLLSLGSAYAFGGGALLDAALDNLLGVDLDNPVSISRQGWAAVFTRLGPVEVVVPSRLIERLPDGTVRVRFEPGPQTLDGPRLAELLTFVSEDSELSQLSSAQGVLEAMFDAFATSTERLDDVFDDGAPMMDRGGNPDDLLALFRHLTEASSNDRLTVLTLPVTSIGAGEVSSFRLDDERARRIVEDHFANSVPLGSTEPGRSLQVLNGNGIPGIGQEVATVLLPAGYRIVLTGNADHFEYDQTRIILYSEDPRHRAAAEDIKQLLGVGEIERSLTPQSVVDITIVVGADFPPGADDLSPTPSVGSAGP